MEVIKKIFIAVFFGSIIGILFTAILSGLVGLIFWGFPEWYMPRETLLVLMVLWIIVGLNVEFKEGN